MLFYSLSLSNLRFKLASSKFLVQTCWVASMCCWEHQFAYEWFELAFWIDANKVFCALMILGGLIWCVVGLIDTNGLFWWVVGGSWSAWWVNMGLVTIGLVYSWLMWVWEREREINSVGCDVKNKRWDVRWIVKWYAKMDKIVFPSVKWGFFKKRWCEYS